MSSRHAASITSIIGLVGVPLQLFLYPRIQDHFGTTRSYKIFSGLFPIAYAMTPFVSLARSNNGGSGLLEGFLLAFILILHTIGRVISVPATISLINDCSPHASMLGTVNGLGQSISAVSRTLGPIIGTILFSRDLESHFTGSSWWILAVVALLGTVLIR